MTKDLNLSANKGWCPQTTNRFDILLATRNEYSSEIDDEKREVDWKKIFELNEIVRKEKN